MRGFRYFSYLCLLFLVAACSSSQYENTIKGAAIGTAAGAGTGAIVGSASGNAGPGVAIGAGLGAISGAIAGYTLDQDAAAQRDLESNLARNEALIEENRKIIEELRSRGAEARGTKRGVVINLPDILFEFDRYNLTSAAKRTIDEIAEVLKGIKNRRISIEGHTDSIGSVKYNKQLSQKRAGEVSRELKRQGVTGKGPFAVRGLGEGYPIATNNSEEGQARNRRVEIIVENY